MPDILLDGFWMWLLFEVGAIVGGVIIYLGVRMLLYWLWPDRF